MRKLTSTEAWSQRALADSIADLAMPANSGLRMTNAGLDGRCFGRRPSGQRRGSLAMRLPCSPGPAINPRWEKAKA